MNWLGEVRGPEGSWLDAIIYYKRLGSELAW